MKQGCSCHHSNTSEAQVFIVTTTCNVSGVVLPIPTPLTLLITVGPPLLPPNWQ